MMLAITFLAHHVPSLSDFGRFQRFVRSLGLPPDSACVVATLEIGVAVVNLSGVLARITTGFFIVYTMCISPVFAGPGRLSK
jgi:uncharacterized membrane protein YphA (DoxX/SURF4 family)